MLSNFARIWIYALSIILVVVMIGIFLNISAVFKYADIRLLNQMRSFSYGLEHYKVDAWHYPVASSMNLEKPFELTEAGFTNGREVYFKGSVSGKGTPSYTSDGQTYTISFKLHGAWREQGLETSQCTITETYVLNCSKNKP